MANNEPQPVTFSFAPIITGIPTPASISPPRPRQIKERTGCYPCKRRKVKCDETIPVCRRCFKRKEQCDRPKLPRHASAIRRIEVEAIKPTVSSCGDVQIEGANWPLLDHWFRMGYRILCNRPPDARNPFSFALLKSLAGSRAATHVFQCLSVAFRSHFQVPLPVECLEERGKALAALRKEVSEQETLHETTLLAIVVFGLSTCWLTDDPSYFGLEHLHAASTLIERFLANYDDSSGFSDEFCTAFGMYIYWDMACSFLAPLADLPVRKPQLHDVARHIDQMRPPHPILGISHELTLILGSIGRLYRKIWATGEPHVRQLEVLETRLLRLWEVPELGSDMAEAGLMANCLREMGCIMLQSLRSPEAQEDVSSSSAERLINALEAIPHNSPYYGFQALVLAMVSRVFTEEKERDLIRHHFRDLYAHNRLRSNLQAEEMVKEVWKYNDKGLQVGLLDVMNQKGWAIMLG